MAAKPKDLRAVAAAAASWEVVATAAARPVMAMARRLGLRVMAEERREVAEAAILAVATRTRRWRCRRRHLLSAGSGSISPRSG